ncbi:MAG: ABC-F family ATP-binding cassette domain-containing protein [Desulfobacteraceae bacterium]|nr:ABC-F family ATP-binding cassette domain-containing protein [Desulfobacteraceae bacterium]
MIPLLTIKSLEKSYGNNNLFSNLYFDLKSKEHIGLIGMNGTGKSTLLKIICGKTLPDTGEAILQNSARCLYVPQKEILDQEKSIEENLYQEIQKHIHGEKELQKAVKRALGTGYFNNADQLCKSLSGGLQKRLAITRAVASEPDLLLLDEPTNHLDINGIIWLEELLKNAGFSFIVITHDRYFLNSVCNNIMELGKQYPDGFLRINGDYNRFDKEKINFIKAQKQQQTSLSSKMRREDQWLKQGAKARTTKAKYRINQAHELREELSILQDRNKNIATVDIDFSTTGRQTKRLVAISDIKKSFNGLKIFDSITLNLMKNSCLGVVGENGSGKSTFISMLAKKTKPDSGKIHWAENLKIGFLDQQRMILDPEITLKQAISPTGKDSVTYRGRTIHIVTWAQKFLFSPRDLDMPVKRFSGGEKAKILIANLMLQPADLLLFDEPANDLDIPSLEILEQSIQEFPGAVVIVSHDRYFLEKVSDQMLYLDGEGNATIVAGYDQILKEKKLKKEKQKIKKISRSKPRKNSEIKFSFNEKFELEHIEEKILKIELNIEELEKSTQDPKITTDPKKLADLCSELQRGKEKSDKLYERWEELEIKKTNSE